jgi:hypothetical protein
MPRLFGSTLDGCSVNQTLHTAASFGIINFDLLWGDLSE